MIQSDTSMTQIVENGSANIRLATFVSILGAVVLYIFRERRNRRRELETSTRNLQCFLWAVTALLLSWGCAVTSLLLCRLSRFGDFEEVWSGIAWSLIGSGNLCYLVSRRHRSLIYRSTNIISLSLFALSTLPREIYPLILLDGRDVSSIGYLECLHILLAALSATIVPLFTPLHNFAHDHPLHPSQLCSPISRWWTYMWMSSFIDAGYRQGGRLTADDLYPLKEESSPSLWTERFLTARQQTSSTGSALWRIFKKRLSLLAFLMILCGAAEFIGSIGLRNLLRYLQGSNDATYKPWFSIIMFASSPIIRGLCMQTFESFSTQTIGCLKGMMASIVYQQLLCQPPGSKIDVGQVNNHISVDIDKLSTLRYTIMAAFMVPVELFVASVLLYQTIGLAYIPGLVIIVITRYPISKFINSALGAAQERILKATDKRVGKMSESIRYMATITMLGQGTAFINKILEVRQQELRAIWKKAVVGTLAEVLSTLCVLIPMALSLFLYTWVAQNRLDAAVAFTTFAVFNILKNMLSLAVIGTGTYSQAMVSLKRVAAFLESGIEAISSTTPDLKQLTLSVPQPLGFQNATFGVENVDGSSIILLQNLNVEFRPGSKTILTGKTGSGKTSFIYALLRELPQLKGITTLRQSHSQSVSFASQSPWLQSGSIRDNILFNSHFLPDRYRETIHACGLEFDLSSLPNGDLTVVGEAGGSLSGGQRQRVALARAIYAETTIVILDDILSALDIATANWIIDKCIFGRLLEGRTLILVSGNLHCKQHADQVITLSHGCIESVVKTDSSGSDLESIEASRSSASSSEITAVESGSERSSIEPEVISESYYTSEESSIAAAGLSQTDFTHQGLIGRLYMFKYIRLFGSWTFLLILAGTVISAQAMDIALSFWLSLWSQAYSRDNSPVNVGYYTGVYCGISSLEILLLASSLLLIYRGAWQVGKSEHEKLLHAVFGASFEWITNTPAGQVINRFSSDMMSVDDSLIGILRPVLESWTSIGFRIMSVSSLIPMFLLPSIFFVSLAVYTGQRYLYASTTAKRLYASSLSPLFSRISETAAGIITIRAFQAEYDFKERFRHDIERHIRAWEAVSDAQRWLAVRMDLLAGAISFSAAILAFYHSGSTPALVGFSLTTSTSLCTALLYLVHLSSILEVEMNSFQRIEDYIQHIPQEQAPRLQNADPMELSNWPTRGTVSVKNLSVGYTLDGRSVLHSINIEAQPGDRIAIVGRTGSGKSSLATSFLRLTTKFQGTIQIDGVDIDHIDPQKLRRSISLIPQDPTLFDGSIRYNLDLGNTIPDSRLEPILHEVMGDKKRSLDDLVNLNGNNFSKGEKQLISLARAIATESRIVIIDEATANLDSASDIRIQTLLRDKFRRSTLIAIAHRLDTIMDFDQVFVLEEGRIVEKGNPKALIQSGSGPFHDLFAQRPSI